MTLIALAAIASMLLAVMQADAKLRAAGSILRWTVALFGVTELVVFGSAVVFRTENPGALPVEIAGPVFTLTLLCCSIGEWRDGKRGREGARDGVAGRTAGEFPAPAQLLAVDGGERRGLRRKRFQQGPI